LKQIAYNAKLNDVDFKLTHDPCVSYSAKTCMQRNIGTSI